MSFQRAKRRLKAVINRKDLTDEMAGDFLLDAIATMERLLRIAPMEFVIDKRDWQDDQNAFPIPKNYLSTIEMFDAEGTYSFCSLHQLLNARPDQKVFTKVADRWLVHPTPQPDQRIYLHYYGETFRPVADSDRSYWTEGGMQAVLYRAAVYAADHFQMGAEDIQKYEAQAQQHYGALETQDQEEKWSAATAVQSPEGYGEY